MKSIVKTALAFSLLLPLAGCWDFGWSKKNQGDHEKSERAMHGKNNENKHKCSHPGCTHDHSKDAAKKSHDKHDKDNNKKHHHDKDMNVATQGMDDMDSDDMNMDDMNADVETQGMDDMDDMDMDDMN